MISLTVTDPTAADAKILRAIVEALAAPAVVTHVVTQSITHAGTSDDIRKAVEKALVKQEARTVVTDDKGMSCAFTDDALLKKYLAENTHRALALSCYDERGVLVSGGAVRPLATGGLVAPVTEYRVNTPLGVVPVAASIVPPPEVAHMARRVDADMTVIASEDRPDAGAPVLTGEKADPAVVFGGGFPNVPVPTPIPPPLPLHNSQTSTPPSIDVGAASPPPPPPPAPLPAAASGAATSTSAVPTDIHGLPWDARIHASTQAKIADGSWKKKRGVEPSVIAEVEAQLRTAMAVPAPAASAWPFPTENPHAGAMAMTFGAMMQVITARIEAKTLTQEQVTAAVRAVGLASLNLVMQRTDLIPAIMVEIAKVPS